MAIHSTGGVLLDQLSGLVPTPAQATPPATALDGKVGDSLRYALENHTHAARVQRTVVTTAADGTYKWVYARPIGCAAGKLPPVAYMVDDVGSPVVVQVIAREFTTSTDGTTDTHTSVTVKAQRSRTLPATLLALSALVSFDIFGVAAASIKVNLWASDPTQ